jgi:acetyltransferase-like isoleucine patch superfamily enzyme
MNAEQLQTETVSGEAARPSLRRRLATSQGSLARLLRRAYRIYNNFAVPAPKIIVKPLLWFFLFVRKNYYFAVRVFLCEPLFKAYCTKYGRNLHTGCYLHWIVGNGDIVLGDNVTIDNTGIGHDCSFTIGKLISIGRNCNLSGEIIIMDSNAHRTDPAARLAFEPPAPEEVRPVIIRDGVWIGRRCILFPGVKIGEGSVISAGSVVRSHVPPYSVVAGNPAKVMFRLKKPDQSMQAK